MNTFAAKYLAGRPEIRGESGRSLGWGGRLESLKVPVRDFDYQHLAQWAECQVSCGVHTQGQMPSPRASVTSLSSDTGDRPLTGALGSGKSAPSAGIKKHREEASILARSVLAVAEKLQEGTGTIYLAGTPPRNSGKSEGSPVELPSVFHLPNWKVFVAGIGFWAVIYRLWK